MEQVGAASTRLYRRLLDVVGSRPSERPYWPVSGRNIACGRPPATRSGRFRV